MPAAVLAPAAILPFLTAGDARFTLVSARTGTRFTYRMEPLARPDAAGAWRPIPGVFRVALLTGPDNGSRASYTYMGTFRAPPAPGAGYYHRRPEPGKALPVSAEAPSARAIAFLLAALIRRPDGSALPPGLAVWHSGRCGRCGRLLTVPESIASGIGPTCAEFTSL